jgi:hypothetical protein
MLCLLNLTVRRSGEHARRHSSGFLMDLPLMALPPTADTPRRAILPLARRITADRFL